MVKYNSARTSATIEIKTRLNPTYSSAELKYFFNDVLQSSPTKTVSSPEGLMSLRVEAWVDGKKIANLALEKLDFIWNHPQVNTPSNFKSGQKGVIVEMFGWPYEDIEQECEMLGKAGYLGVKVFPPQ